MAVKPQLNVGFCSKFDSRQMTDGCWREQCSFLVWNSGKIFLLTYPHINYKYKQIPLFVAQHEVSRSGRVKANRNSQFSDDWLTSSRKRHIQGLECWYVTSNSWSVVSTSRLRAVIADWVPLSQITLESDRHLTVTEIINEVEIIYTSTFRWYIFNSLS